MKANGLREQILEMVEEFKYGLMDLDMKVIGKVIEPTEEAG